MAISLTKGANINLSKDSPNLSKISIGLGWSTRATTGADFDLDATAFMLKADSRVRSDADFIFYKQLSSTCKSVIHQGDNRTGDGEGDDEVIKVDLKKVPSDIAKIVFCVTIHDYDKRKQNFGMVSDAFIRLVNDESAQEIARYDLTEDASTMTAMLFGELYRYNADWKFRAIGQGFSGGLAEMARNFGVDVE